MSSNCVLGNGAKVAGFDSRGILYIVQLRTNSDNEQNLLIFKFNSLTQQTNLAKTLKVYPNQPVEQTTFIVPGVSSICNYLGIYIQYSEIYWSKEQLPSWFLEINLDTFEETRNPCSFPKLESDSCSLFHTDTRWGWILCGYALGDGLREFEFHSFQSGIGKGYSNQYFDASLLTVAETTVPVQRLGVFGDKLYSIYPRIGGLWSFSFFDLNSDSNSPSFHWNQLTVSQSVSGIVPQQISRLFLVDGKLCGLELHSDRVINVWKVEKGRGDISARWNLWKRISARREGDVRDIIVSPKLDFTPNLVALKISPSRTSKILLNSIQISSLDPPSLKYTSAKKLFENFPQLFDEAKLVDYFTPLNETMIHRLTELRDD